MKLSERLKRIPRDKLIIGITLLVLLVATVAIITVCALIPPEDEAQSEPPKKNDDLVVNVFNELTETSAEVEETTPDITEGLTEPDTADGTEETTTDTEAAETEPSVPTDVNGLVYRSNGDGTCSVTGIGTCEAVEIKIPAKSPLGDTVTSIGDRAFEDCYEIMTVTIPATVKTIGTGAFRGCGGLSFISVDALNPAFCSVDGVLYSKDKSVLICYPQSRSGSRYLLPTSVKTVSAYAFENVLNLTGILYEGSIVKFQSIDVLAGNEKFSSLSITCNYASN